MTKKIGEKIEFYVKRKGNKKKKISFIVSKSYKKAIKLCKRCKRRDERFAVYCKKEGLCRSCYSTVHHDKKRAAETQAKYVRRPEIMAHRAAYYRDYYKKNHDKWKTYQRKYFRKHYAKTARLKHQDGKNSHGS